jgi:hypothetical protein
MFNRRQAESAGEDVTMGVRAIAVITTGETRVVKMAESDTAAMTGTGTETQIKIEALAPDD